MKDKKYNLEVLKEVVEYFGGLQATANKIGVHKQSLGKWLYSGNSPSIQSCMKIQKESNGKFLASDIRPDIEW